MLFFFAERRSFSTALTPSFLPDARSCTTCDRVLQELEQIDDDTDSFGVDFVKINDKRLAKHYGITKFPALTYFREKKPIIYEGACVIQDRFALTTAVYDLFNCALFTEYAYKRLFPTSQSREQMQR